MAGLFSISYMGCHPKPIDELIFFKMVITPPTSHLWTMAHMVFEVCNASFKASNGYIMTPHNIRDRFGGCEKYCIGGWDDSL